MALGFARLVLCLRHVVERCRRSVNGEGEGAMPALAAWRVLLLCCGVENVLRWYTLPCSRVERMMLRACVCAAMGFAKLRCFHVDFIL